MNPLSLFQKIIGGALLAAILTLGVLLAIQKGETQHWRKVAAGKQATIEKLLEAQALANAQAMSAKLAKEAADAQRTKEINDARKDQRARDDARFDEWVRAHRTDQGGSGKADLPGATPASGQPEGAGPTVAVDAGWLRICARNTRDLANAREWAAKTWSESLKEANR